MFSIAWNVVERADGGKHLRLFDGIDAEVGFQVQIEVQHVLGIAGLLHNEREYALLHRVGCRSSVRSDGCCDWLSFEIRVVDCTDLWRNRRLRNSRWLAGRSLDCELWRGRGFRIRNDFRCLHRHACVMHTQRVLNHFQISAWSARDSGKPSFPCFSIHDAVGIAEMRFCWDERGLWSAPSAAASC